LRRVDFEHLIAAAADVCGEREIVVLGSQAILGSRREVRPELLISMEADLYPRRTPAKAEAIDEALGDGSQFHRTFGYYARGVGPETAKAPAGWEERLVAVSIPPRPGREGLVESDVLLERVDDLPVAASVRRRVRSMLGGIRDKLSPSN
jgi:hypothetical protein